MSTFTATTALKPGDVVRFGDGHLDVVTYFTDYGADPESSPRSWPSGGRFELATANDNNGGNVYYQDGQTFQAWIPEGPGLSNLVSNLTGLLGADAVLEDVLIRDDLAVRRHVSRATDEIQEAILMTASLLIEAAEQETTG